MCSSTIVYHWVEVVHKVVDGLTWHLPAFMPGPRKGLHPTRTRGCTVRVTLGAGPHANTPVSEHLFPVDSTAAPRHSGRPPL